MNKKNVNTSIAKPKKEYEKPKITSEKVFETAALSCGKCIRRNPIFQGGCMGVPRLS